jgi:hypothetical protein
MTEVKNKEWINKQIEQHLLETEGEEYTGYEAGIEFVQLLIEETRVELNEDQQTVLNGLKEFHAVNHSSIATLYELHKKNMQTDSKTVEIWKAYRELSAFEGFQVMQAFAEWGQSND